MKLKLWEAMISFSNFFLVFHGLTQQFQSKTLNHTQPWSLKPLLDSVIAVKICFSICTMTLQGSLYWGNRKIYLPAFITVNLLVGCSGNRKRCSQQEVQLANSSSLRVIACTLDNWRSYHSLLLIWNCNIIPLHICNFCQLFSHNLLYHYFSGNQMSLAQFALAI